MAEEKEKNEEGCMSPCPWQWGRPPLDSGCVCQLCGEPMCSEARSGLPSHRECFAKAEENPRAFILETIEKAVNDKSFVHDCLFPPHRRLPCSVEKHKSGKSFYATRLFFRRHFGEVTIKWAAGEAEASLEDGSFARLLRSRIENTLDDFIEEPVASSLEESYRERGLVVRQEKKKDPDETGWKFKEGAKPQGSSDGFWYDIGMGGGIDLEKLLDDGAQQAAVSVAVDRLMDFEKALRDAGLLNEF